MKIKLITLGLTFLSTFNSFAQVTITSATFQPAQNETFGYKNITGTVNPGAAGANVTWDFSAVTTGSTVLNYFVESCSGNGDCANYPGASYYIGSTGLGLKTFYINNSGSLQENGSIANGASTIYSDPQTVLKFPATYNQTFTDNFALSASVSGGTQSATGTANINVDGYGTLKTPTGTYSGVLRVKTNLSQVVNITTASGTVMSTQTTQSYTWYKPGIAHEIMTIISVTISSSGGSAGNTVAYYTTTNPNGNTTGINGLNDESVAFKVFPNPSKGTFRINLDNEKINNVIVRDLLGKTMFQQKVNLFGNNNNSVDVNTSGWPKGIYLIEVACMESSSVQKIVVE